MAHVGNAELTISILRTLLIVIALGLPLALTACGGSEQTAADEPRLPRALASDLAGLSERIAEALDAGDVCGAAQLADELKDAAEAATAAGEIPPELQNELAQATVELQNGVNCEAPPEDEEKDEKDEMDEKDEEKKDEEKKDDEKDDKGEDEEKVDEEEEQE